MTAIVSTSGEPTSQSDANVHQPVRIVYPKLVMPDRQARRQLFNRMDVNGNGGLSLAEIDKAVVEGLVGPVLGAADFNHKPALIRAYKAADTSEDGFIERSEFSKLLFFLVYFNNLWHKFEEIDSDHDRRISAEEFAAGCATVGLDLTPEEAAAEFAACDTDGGGMILFGEFCTWCAAREYRPDEDEDEDEETKKEPDEAAAALGSDVEPSDTPAEPPAEGVPLEPEADTSVVVSPGKAAAAAVSAEEAGMPNLSAVAAAIGSDIHDLMQKPEETEDAHEEGSEVSLGQAEGRPAKEEPQAAALPDRPDSQPDVVANADQAVDSTEALALHYQESAESNETGIMAPQQDEAAIYALAASDDLAALSPPSAAFKQLQDEIAATQEAAKGFSNETVTASATEDPESSSLEQETEAAKAVLEAVTAAASMPSPGAQPNEVVQSATDDGSADVLSEDVTETQPETDSEVAAAAESAPDKEEDQVVFDPAFGELAAVLTYIDADAGAGADADAAADADADADVKEPEPEPESELEQEPESEPQQVIVSETAEELEVAIGDRLYLVDVASETVFQIVPEEAEVGTWDTAARRIIFTPASVDGQGQEDHGGVGGGEVVREETSATPEAVKPAEAQDDDKGDEGDSESDLAPLPELEPSIATKPPAAGERRRYSVALAPGALDDFLAVVDVPPSVGEEESALDAAGGSSHDALNTLRVVCPDGVSPGDALFVQTPEGQEIETAVPEGITPGDEFDVDLSSLQQQNPQHQQQEQGADEAQQQQHDDEEEGEEGEASDGLADLAEGTLEPTPPPQQPPKRPDRSKRKYSVSLKPGALDDFLQEIEPESAAVDEVAAEGMMLLVGVPEGMSGGELLYVGTPDGREIVVTIPEGISGGESIEVDVGETAITVEEYERRQHEEEEEEEEHHDEDEDDVTVTVPEGSNPGDVIVIETPAGLELEVEIPEGYSPGEEFVVTTPR